MSLLAASALWGTTGTAAALAASGAAPPVAGAARLIVGAILLGAIVAASRWWGAVRALAREDARWWVLAAGGAAAAYQVAFFSAVDSTGVAVGTLIVLGSATIACGLLGRWWAAEGLTRGWFTATGFALVGCALLVLPGGGAAVRPAGVALALAAGGCYGIYTVSAKRLLRSGHDATSVLAATLGLGAVLLTPVLLSDPGPLLELRGLILVVWLGVAATALAYVLFARGLRHVSAATAGTLSLAEPLTAAALGVTVLAERPSTSAGAGALLVLGGLIIAAVAPQPRSTLSGAGVVNPAVAA